MSEIAFRPAPTVSYTAKREYREDGRDLPDGEMTGQGWEAVQSGTFRACWDVYQNGVKRGGTEAMNYACIYTVREGSDPKNRLYDLGYEFPDEFDSREAAAVAVMQWWKEHGE